MLIIIAIYISYISYIVRFLFSTQNNLFNNTIGLSKLINISLTD